jgi:hypothetical protein
MLTLERSSSTPAEHRNDAEPTDTRDGHSGRDVDAPMACESLVADAVCHLVTGFFTIEKLGPEIQNSSQVADPLEKVSENICTVLERLDECSNAFWLSLKVRSPTLCRVRRLGDAFSSLRRTRR